jgi:hypothetical protein
MIFSHSDVRTFELKKSFFKSVQRNLLKELKPAASFMIHFTIRQLSGLNSDFVSDRDELIACVQIELRM